MTPLRREGKVAMRRHKKQLAENMRKIIFYAITGTVVALTLSCMESPRNKRATTGASVGKPTLEALAGNTEANRHGEGKPEGKGGADATSLEHAIGDLTKAVATPDGTPAQILANKAYVSSFNNTTLMPNWVAWKLAGTHVNGGADRKKHAFTPDSRVDEAYRVTTHDYVRSGYDRGHMCPAADNKWSDEAMTQSFLMTNICPQDHGLNVGDWNEMENQCRRWASKYGEVYVLCGPILLRGKHKRIGKEHKVTVPEAFFKVVLCLEGTPKGIGFIYRNEDGDRPKGDYVNSIDQVERITGFDFFPSLPDDVERTVEARADLAEW